MDEVEIVRNIEDAGFAAKRRNMHYDILGDPIFRQREVPRMLELATGARRRRYERSGGAADISGEKPRGQTAARPFPIDRYPRVLGAAHLRTANERRLDRVDREPAIVALGRRAPPTAGARDVELGHVAVMPGLVNSAHPFGALVSA